MVKPLLFGDTFGVFNCSVCNEGPETFQRKGLSWISIVHLVIYNLIRNAQIEDEKKPKKDRRDHYYFRWKEDVCAFIDNYWDYLIPDKQRSLTWNNTIASVLSTHSNIFLSGLEKFHQSAWWTLHKIEPPSSEKKSKAAAKLKPNLKKPLKRTKIENDNLPKQKRLKKIKKEQRKEEEEDTDLLDFSSLSELSSANESSSETEDKPTRAFKENMAKKKKSSKEQNTKPVVKVKEEEQPVALASFGSPSKLISVNMSQSSIPSVSPNPSLSPSSTVQTLHTTPNLSPSVSITTEIPKSQEIQLISESPSLPPHEESIPITSTPQSVKTSTHTTLQNSSLGTSALTPQGEWLLLQKLERSSKNLTSAAHRYKRKLAVRRLKRNLGIKLFDIDQHLVNLLRMPKHNLEPISKETIIQPASNQYIEQQQDDQQQLLDKITFTPYTSSFASRLYGSIRQCNTITREEPWLSSWNGRKLRPFIRRDFQSKPKRMLLLGQIKACKGKPIAKGEKEPSGIIEGESIDYVYFQKEHLEQVNRLLSRSFWEGIDVSESLLFPEFSIVALYKRHVIGCAFMTPEAYITYFTVDPGWRNANIGQFMLYHLFQTAIGKDITLHVFANNNAMILYQKFGFKPEEFIVNFYDKYLPADSSFSKNAFFLRLRR
ncbi:uncharacterized protein BX663DRAFT_514958 [Cokeromyces recurvatus]|uniref:uncharacterized protein n=1 Tax=Cokeromyces recurvatus TaxID=90255 RepID=UPI00221E9888|nr:uncharacterized protein BX663DRAFT_514958 [Cokeromyces recurvatus]KAI7901112.1 hypothetical protein BX663DRAFT_514958 [Cokeromyces recurvatus]